MKFNRKMLVEMRKKKNLTRSELARKMQPMMPKISGATIRTWEMGECNPKLNSLIALSKVFNIDFSVLLKK